jgi:type VI secretion system secreted protein Hcp
MRSLTAVSMALLCSLALVAPSLALAAQDIFLVVSGLDGGSADAQFTGAFEGTAVESGVRSEQGAGGGGAGAGRVTFSPLVVTLRGTAASSALEQAAATGEHFPQAVVSIRRAGESPVVFLTYTLTDVTVTSFQRDVAAPADAPSEAVGLAFATIKTDFQQQNPDGSAGPVVSVCWDVRASRPCQTAAVAR